MTHIEAIESRRNIERLRTWSNVALDICEYADQQQRTIDALRLSAAYYKAMLFDKKELAALLKQELSNAGRHQCFETLDDLEARGRITFQDAAFCRNYEE